MSGQLLEIVDPWGRVIVLTTERWGGHIVTGHPEMETQFEALRNTVLDPHLVTFDALHPSRENYYRFDVRGPLLLKVCVHFTAQPGQIPPTGIIVTAYLTGRVKPKERVKWSSST